MEEYTWQELYSEESLPSSGHAVLKHNKNPGHLKENIAT